MRHTLLAVSSALLLASGAWAADSDAEFVSKAASGGLMEVELGRHASQHASNPSVRTFGQRMVTDHTKANAELAAVAKRQGLAVPKEMNADHRSEVQKLTEKSGAEFDEAYMEMMVEDHEHDVAEFRDQAKESKSEVDRFAAKTLPTLEQHLSQARAVEDTLDARSGASYRGEHDAHQRTSGAADTADDRP